MMIQSCVFLIVTIFIPLPTDQHFIWPVDMCVLADLCNHTWIPECGLERDEGYYRLFLDECDMFEFNCDRKVYFESRNYSECFHDGPCPPLKCPPTKECPKHRKAHDGFLFFRDARDHTGPATPPPNLPRHMLRGKRRYTPNKYKTTLPNRDEPFPRNILQMIQNQLDKQKTTKPQPKTSPKRKTHTRTSRTAKLTLKSILRTELTSSMWDTKIIKTNFILKHGVKVMKVYKGINLEYRTTKKLIKDFDAFNFNKSI